MATIVIRSPLKAAAHAILRTPGWLLKGAARAVWFLVRLPFQLFMAIMGLLGRLAGITLGFTLMVIGMALWAGPLFLLGIPLFLVGLLLTLRSLG